MANFTKNSVTLNNGTTFPATYHVNDDETIVIRAALPDGKIAKIELPKTHDDYSAAMLAAQAAAEDKKARGPVPEKTFIGTKITGPDWRIEFGSERTRIIFKKYPCQAYRDAVKAAGFYWSPKDKSWNKKATFKAYRAAQAVHTALWQIREGKAVTA